MDRRLAAPESEAFTLSDSSLQLTKARSNFQLDSTKGIRLPETTEEANPLTIGSEGEMRKGRLESRRAPTAVPPGARVQQGVRGAVGSEGPRRAASPEAKSLEVGERFKREVIYEYLCLVHVVEWQKPTPHCKAVILQLKINLKNSFQN